MEYIEPIILIVLIFSGLILLGLGLYSYLDGENGYMHLLSGIITIVIGCYGMATHEEKIVSCATITIIEPE